MFIINIGEPDCREKILSDDCPILPWQTKFQYEYTVHIPLLWCHNSYEFLVNDVTERNLLQKDEKPLEN